MEVCKIKPEYTYLYYTDQLIQDVWRIKPDVMNVSTNDVKEYCINGVNVNFS
jgi:hypothetical protein